LVLLVLLLLGLLLVLVLVVLVVLVLLLLVLVLVLGLAVRSTHDLLSATNNKIASGFRLPSRPSSKLPPESLAARFDGRWSCGGCGTRCAGGCRCWLVGWLVGSLVGKGVGAEGQGVGVGCGGCWELLVGGEKGRGATW
jgi:hypothetical protein